MWGFAYVMDQLTKAVWILLIVCIISVPLGIWKLVEIIIWIVNHVSISVN